MNIPFSVLVLRTWLIRLTRILLSPWLRSFQLSTEDIKSAEDLSQKGLVVYVMRSASILDVAFLTAILARHRLPGIAWTNTVSIWSKRKIAGSRFAENAAGLIFLRVGGGIVSTRFVKLEAKLESLIEWCRHEEHKVYLVPVVSIWQRQPQTIETSLLDIVFGPVERPGILRRLVWLVRFAKEIRVSFAQEIDLTEFSASRAEYNAHQVARRIRLSIARHFAGGERSVLGPRLKKREQMLQMVVKDRVVQQAIDELSDTTGLARDSLEETALKDAREIAANYDIRTIRFLEWVLSRVLTLIFSGMYVDLPGLKRLRNASKDGSLLLLPCHKSHLDYLMLSYIFKVNGLPPPHIAAGINLSFWPMGSLFRRSGAFFLRRSFAGDKIYKVVFETYVKILLREGFNIEFFIEGTRSRAGRLMQPRFGMMQMVIDAIQNSSNPPKVICVPIGIDYEMLVEQKSIEMELLGKEKKPENLGSLVGARKKLRSNFGSAFLRIGEPFSLNEWLEHHNNLESKEAVEQVSFEIMQDIGKSGTVTESALLATALCIHHKRGIEAESLDRKILMLRTLLQDRQIGLSEDFAYCRNRQEEVRTLFRSKGLMEEVTLHDKHIFMIPDDRRLILDYYKNNLLHHLAPLSVAAWAFNASEEDPEKGFSKENLFERYSFLWSLIEEQFNRRFLPPTMIEFMEQIAIFEKYDWIIPVGEGGYRIEEIKPLRALENLTINYYESIYVVLLTLWEELGVKATQKQWTKNCLEMANLLYAKGDIWRFESRSKANLEATLKEFIRFGWLSEAEGSNTTKRKRDSIQYEITEEQRGLLGSNLQTIRTLVIMRKFS